jgi:periplasmic protein CpxP/Spy
MNQFSGNKILLTIIAILLITNVVMLVLFLRLEKPASAENKRLGFTEKLKNQVGFTPEQMAIFEPKKKAFWKNVRERFDEIKQTKENFYYQLYDSTISDSVLQAKAEVIGRQQMELDLQVIRHFRDIRKLCTPKQLPKYDSLLPPLIERMTARPERK